MQLAAEQSKLDVLIEQATRELIGQGWKVADTRSSLEAPWHLVARKGERWRVIQIVPPATTPAVRQARRLDLGDAVRMPSRAGTMEQWLAHMRPDGIITFGPYVLNAQRWAGTDQQWYSDGGISRLGSFTIAASPHR